MKGFHKLNIRPVMFKYSFLLCNESKLGATHSLRQTAEVSIVLIVAMTLSIYTKIIRYSLP